MTSLLHAEVIQKVDTYIDDLVALRRERATRMSPVYTELWESIDHVIGAGGKRVRPYLTVLAYGRSDDRIIPVAAAQELLHVALLVHDDIIDQDDMRRGSVNINGLYLRRYSKYLDHASARHYAYGSAILAGDLLIAEAMQLIARSDFSVGITDQLIEAMHDAVYAVAGGELMDVEASFARDMEINPLDIARYKTAIYSFVSPLVSGASCRDADADEKQLLTEIGENIGIGFQLQDDLLGVFGDQEETGKTALLDLREGKATCIIDAYRERMDEMGRNEFDKTFGNPSASEDDLSRLREAIEQSGARAAVEARVDEYFARAVRGIDRLQDEKLVDGLKYMLSALTARKA